MLCRRMRFFSSKRSKKKNAPSLDVNGGVEDLFDLPRHHREELLGRHELEIDGGLADALTRLVRRREHWSSCSRVMTPKR